MQGHRKEEKTKKEEKERIKKAKEDKDSNKERDSNGLFVSKSKDGDVDAAKEGTKDVDKASAEGGGEVKTDDSMGKKNDADTDVAEADKSGNIAPPAPTGGEEAKHPREEDNNGGETDEDEPSAKKAKVAGDVS